jgi:hypothetical protein
MNSSFWRTRTSKYREGGREEGREGGRGAQREGTTYIGQKKGGREGGKEGGRGGMHGRTKDDRGKRNDNLTKSIFEEEEQEEN